MFLAWVLVVAELARGAAANALLSLNAEAENNAAVEDWLVLKVVVFTEVVLSVLVVDADLTELAVSVVATLDSTFCASVVLFSVDLLSLLSWVASVLALFSVLLSATASTLLSSIALVVSDVLFSVTSVVYAVLSSLEVSANVPSFLDALKEATLLSWPSIVVSVVLLDLFWSSETTWL